MRLNLGCSDRALPGFVGVDVTPPAADDTPDIYQQADLSEPWPWADSSINEVIALDVIEHIGDSHAQRKQCSVCGGTGKLNMEIVDIVCYGCGGSGYKALRHANGRIHFMNELHRVLKPGARATIETPNASRGNGYFQDPTHVSPWCLSTFKYFERGAFAHTRLSKLYGITAAFSVVSIEERETSGEDRRERAWKITAILEAVK